MNNYSNNSWNFQYNYLKNENTSDNGDDDDVRDWTADDDNNTAAFMGGFSWRKKMQVDLGV